MLQPRPNIAEAVIEPSFLYKWVLTLTLLASALVLMLQLARPQPLSRNGLLLLLAPVGVLALGVAYELLTLPSSDWMPTMIGTSAAACMTYIPMLVGAAVGRAASGPAPGRPFAAGADGRGGGPGRHRHRRHVLCLALHERQPAVHGRLVCRRHGDYGGRRRAVSAPACCAGSAAKVPD